MFKLGSRVRSIASGRFGELVGWQASNRRQCLQDGVVVLVARVRDDRGLFLVREELLRRGHRPGTGRPVVEIAYTERELYLAKQIGLSPAEVRKELAE